MKKHNGGAISIVCQHLTSMNEIDNYFSSGIAYSSLINQTLADNFDSTIVYSLNPNQTMISLNTFEENYSGFKGLTIYAKYLSSLVVQDNTFLNNMAVYAFSESLVSPYYKSFYSKGRFLTYSEDSGTCFDELEYINRCAFSGITIDFPIVQGTIYIEHCAEQSCQGQNQNQASIIRRNTFDNNDIGPYLNLDIAFQRAANIFILNGFQINSQPYYIPAQMYARAPILLNYMPTGYFNSTQAPQIFLNHAASRPASPSDYLYFNASITSCLFQNNYHYQVIGMSDTNSQYQGAIAQLSSTMSKDNLVLSTLKLINNTFRDNIVKGPGLSMVSISNAFLQASNNNFTNCGYLSDVVKAKISSQVNTTNAGYFPYQNYKFTEALNYGVFRILITSNIPSNQFFNFTNNSFSYVFGYTGAIYSISYQYTIAAFFSKNNYSNIFAFSGALLDSSLSQSSSTQTVVPYLNFTKENFTNIYSYLYGALYIHDNENQHMLYVNDSQFTNCFGQYGSAITLDSGGVSFCNKCNFSVNSWGIAFKNATVISQFKSSNQKEISDFISSSFLNNITNVTTQQGYVSFLNSWNGLSSQTLLNNPTSSKQLNSYLQIFTGVDSQYSKFVDCRFTNLRAVYGSAVYSQFSYIFILNSKRDDSNTPYIISNNIATYGTIAVFQSSFMKLTNLKLDQNVATQGSALNVQQKSTLIVNQTLIQSHTVLDKGTIYLINLSNLTMIGSLVTNNTANADSSFIFGLYNDQPGLINVTDSFIMKNRAVANTMNMIYSQANITNTVIADNVAQKVNHGITLISSVIYLRNITVNYTNPMILADGDLYVDAGFLNLNFQSTLYLENSLLMNCRGKLAAVIYATGSSTIYISANTRIFQAYSSQGTILQFLSTNKVIIQKTHFQDNFQTNIYFESAVLEIDNSTFINAGNQYIVGKNGDLYLSQVTMKDNYNTQLQGIGVYCNCHTIQILNSTFQNLTSSQGGALYLQSFKDSKFLIQNSAFVSNSAQQGGAIFIEEAQNMSIKSNNFTLNKAEKPKDSSTLDAMIGGAVYFQCPSSYGYACNVTIQGQNQFANNSAENQGGALAYANIAYKQDGSSIFNNNSSPYGADQSSYAKSLVFKMITNNDYLNTPFLIPMNLTLRQRALVDREYLSTEDAQIVSGVAFSFSVTLYDQEGVLMSQENIATATIKVNSTNGVKSIVLSNNEAKASSGVFLFSNVLLIAPPGSTIGFQLSLSSMETYGNKIGFIDNPLTFNIVTRLCASGEEYTTDYRCVKCPPAFYLYEAPNEPTSCKDCSPYATCFAGNVVAPIAGFWRSSNTSDTFVKCPRVESCLGGSLDNPLGKCAIGYEGEACGICQPGFSKVSNFECSKCPSAINNIVKLTFVFMGVIVIIVFLVRSTLQSADKQKPVYSVYLKIIANHFQIIGTLSSIDFSWPSEIQKLEDSQQTVSSVSEQVFSFDCFLMGNDQSQGYDGQIYYMKLIFFAFLPAILSFGATVYWLIHSIIRQNFSELKNSLISTIVIVLFLVHPNIAKAMFSSFNCTQIDQELRLMPDISQICFQGKHSVYLYTVSAPSVILWAFGIPLFALVLLLKNKKIILQIESQQIQSKADKWTIKRIKTQLGFLFNGYKIKSFYWEIIILYRKIMLIMVTVFLSSVSPETQVLVGLIIIIVSIMLQIRIRPYYTNTLNRMESYSLMVSAVTLYAGMFYITGRNYSYMSNNGVKWFFLISIALPNVIFLSYWVYNMAIEILKVLLTNNQFKLFRFLTCRKVNIDKFERRYMRATVNRGFDDEEIVDDQEYDKNSRQAAGLKYQVKDQDNPLDQLDKSRTPREKLLAENVTTRRDETISVIYNDPPTTTHRGDKFIGDSNSKLVKDDSFLDLSDDFHSIPKSHRKTKSILKNRNHGHEETLIQEGKNKKQLNAIRKQRFFEDQEQEVDQISLDDVRLDINQIQEGKKAKSVFHLNLGQKYHQTKILNDPNILEETFNEIKPKQNIHQAPAFNDDTFHFQPQNKERSFQVSSKSTSHKSYEEEIKKKATTHREHSSVSQVGTNMNGNNGLLSFRSNHKVFPLEQLKRVKESILTHRQHTNTIFGEEDQRKNTLKNLKKIQNTQVMESKIHKKQVQLGETDFYKTPNQNIQVKVNDEEEEAVRKLNIANPFQDSYVNENDQNQENLKPLNEFAHGTEISSKDKRKMQKHNNKMKKKKAKQNKNEFEKEFYPFEEPVKLLDEQQIKSLIERDNDISKQNVKPSNYESSQNNTQKMKYTQKAKNNQEKESQSSKEFLIHQLQDFYETEDEKENGLNEIQAKISHQIGQPQVEEVSFQIKPKQKAFHDSDWEQDDNDNHLKPQQQVDQNNENQLTYLKNQFLKLQNSFFQTTPKPSIQDDENKRNHFLERNIQQIEQKPTPVGLEQNPQKDIDFYPLQNAKTLRYNFDEEWEQDQDTQQLKSKGKNIFKQKKRLQKEEQKIPAFEDNVIKDASNRSNSKNIFEKKKLENSDFNRQQVFKNPFL